MKPVKNTFFSPSSLKAVRWERTWLRGSPASLSFPICLCLFSFVATWTKLWPHVTITRLLRAVQRRQLKEQTTWKFPNYGNRLRFWNGCWSTAAWKKGYAAIKYDSKFRVWTQDFVSFRFCRLSSEMHSVGLTKSTEIQTNPFSYWGPAPCHPDLFLIHRVKNTHWFQKMFQIKDWSICA